MREGTRATLDEKRGVGVSSARPAVDVGACGPLSQCLGFDWVADDMKGYLSHQSRCSAAWTALTDTNEFNQCKCIA